MTNIKNKLIGDSIKIEGLVEIRNGDTVIKAKNKFVQTMLQYILNWLSMGQTPLGYYTQYGPAYNYNIYIGSDTIIPTVYNTSVLTSPIGATPGTAPNSKSASVTNPSAVIFRIIINATWIPGSVSGTVGEMALYLNLLPAGNLRSYGWYSTYQPTSAILASRLAVADGTFSPFTINTANPLVIAWTINISF